MSGMETLQSEARRPASGDTASEITRLKAANAAMTQALRSAEAVVRLEIGPESHPTHICQSLLGSIQDIVETRGLGVFLLDLETMQFELTAAVPNDQGEQIRSEFERQVAQGAIGLALRECRAVTAPPLADTANAAAHGVIICPIATPGRAWGIALCYSHEPPRGLDANALRLLGIVTHNVARAIENAALLRVLGEQARNIEEAVRSRYGKDLAEKERLANACEQLQRVNASRDDFISLLGHELRTPLASIISLCEFLVPGDCKEDARAEFAAAIHAEALRMHRLVNDVLDLAKMEAGKLCCRFTKSDLNDLVELCITSVKSTALKRRITIRFVKDEHLAMFPFAPDRLQQVILNMLSNAIKFSEDGGEIIVVSRDDGESAFLSVQDFGEGIAARDIPKVFNKFEQIRPRDHQENGTGFGMPLAKNIIEAGHGGTMWLASEGRGKGATFFFTLPKNLADEEDKPQAPDIAQRKDASAPEFSVHG